MSKIRVPSDEQVLKNPDLQMIYKLLEMVRNYMKQNYPDVTHIAGFRLPKED